MDYTKLSKTLSHALRHEPKKYNIVLDNEGWADISMLLNSLKLQNKWKDLCVSDIVKVADTGYKKRFEIQALKIRALYGHSSKNSVDKVASEPPEFLMHGTARDNIDSIKKIGLIPKGRQYVHLTEDFKIAKKVALRYDENPVLIRIYSKQAYIDGVKFYFGHEDIWLSDPIALKYIEFIDNGFE